MKAFYIIIFVFAVTLSLIVCNSTTVNRFVEDTEVGIEKLEFSHDEKFAEDVAEFSDKVNAELKKLEYSLPNKKVSLLRDLLSQLCAQAASGQSEDFEVTRALTLNQLAGIAELERVSLSNIF